MESLYFWVPMVLILSAGAVAIYVWAVNDGQYDDLDRQAQQMLFDDQSPPEAPDSPPTSTAPPVSRHD
jgi:cbb3-type cytochrome oxidase maturation protein